MNPLPHIGPSRKSALTRWQFRAFRLGLHFPEAWWSTARRRRFLFLGLSAPGFLGVAALPLHENLWALLLGLAGMGLACGFRTLSEPMFLTTGDENAQVQTPQA